MLSLHVMLAFNMQVMGLVDIFRAKIVDISEDSLTVEVTIDQPYWCFNMTFICCILFFELFHKPKRHITLMGKDAGNW